MALHRDDPPVALAIRAAGLASGVAEPALVPRCFTSVAFRLRLCFDRVLFIITGLVGESDRLSVP